MSMGRSRYVASPPSAVAPARCYDAGVDDAALRRAIGREREQTAARLEALDRTFQELVDAADLEPPDDEHDPDGTTAYERAQVTSLAAEARARLAQLDVALATEGDLTRCAACGRGIADERLGALPGVRTCIDCARHGRTG